MAGRLAGKTAIVTGATGGIGLATCRLFLAERARLILVSRSAVARQDLAKEFGRENTLFVAGDVADEATAKRAVAAAAQLGGVDILVNNAGIDYNGPIIEAPLDEVLRVMRVNFVGAFLMLREAARAMAARGGSIVNVISRTASVGVPGMAIYAASKGALLSLGRTAAVELANQHIRVNAVAPGLTKTPMLSVWLGEQSDAAAFEQDLLTTIPMREFARPEDVANAILYLASDESEHVTGACIAVDGGYTAA